MAGGALSPAVIKASGAGKAYQSVTQSTAIAIGDATSYLRNIETIATAAAATAMAQFLATKNAQYLEIIPVALLTVTTATTQFATISADAIVIANTYPSG